jgi:hypothetical protein
MGRRNMVVVNMMDRSAKAGRHPDKKKRANKKACRQKVSLSYGKEHHTRTRE